MSHELFYTSAPRGLRTGEHGFCTVAATRGIPAALAAKLESLCGYRHLFPPSDKRASLNPVMYSHLRLQIDGKTYHVLSRIADAGLDHTQRTNKFAHHVALERNELTPGGPAFALMQRGFLETDWGDRAPQVIDAGRRPPSDDAPPRRCQRWEEATGDAGWGGVLAGMTTPNKPTYLIFRPGVDPLPLIAEAMALLPPQQRWGVTFSTYFLGLPPDVPCQWRCLVEGSPEAKAVLESGNANVILLETDQEPAPDGPLVEAARTGRVRHEAPVAARPQRTATPVAAPAPMPVRVQALAAVPVPLHEPNAAPFPQEAAPMPIADAPHSSGRFGILPLLLGLAMGLALMCLCILPVELLSGRSLPRFAGISGKDEQELQAKIDSLQKDVEREKKQSESMRREVDDLRDALARANAELKRKPEDGKVNPKPGPRNDPPEQKPAGFWKWLTERWKQMPAKKPPDAPAEPKSPQPSPMPMAIDPAKPIDPAPTKREVGSPLQLPLPDPRMVGKPAQLTGVTSKGGSPELLGFPNSIDKVPLTLERPPESLVVKFGQNALATFHQRPDGMWEFIWSADATRPEFEAARRALLRCALRLKLADGSAIYYPLQPPESIKPTFTRSRSDQETIFKADLPFDSFILGESADVALDGGFPISLKREGNGLAGKTESGDRQLELTLDGATLQVKCTGPKSAVDTCVVQRLRLKRDFDGQKIEVATITK